MAYKRYDNNGGDSAINAIAFILFMAGICVAVVYMAH